VIPPLKRIAEGSRRPSWRAGFLLLLFFARQRKVEKNKTGALEGVQKPVLSAIIKRLDSHPRLRGDKLFAGMTGLEIDPGE
jgi:hypothetical protein